MNKQLSPAMQALRVAHQRNFNERSVSIQTATAGYYVLELCNEEDGAPYDLLRHPVVAWKYDLSDEHRFFIPEPITLGGATDTNDYLQNAPVLTPCGLVRIGNDYCWNSEADYLKERQEDYQREKAIKQKGKS